MSVTNGVKCFKKHHILQNLDYLSYKFLTPSNQVLTLCTKNATDTHNTKMILSLQFKCRPALKIVSRLSDLEDEFGHIELFLNIPTPLFRPAWLVY